MADTLPIDAIRIERRFRSDLGDLQPLVKSIDSLGLLHPIVVRPDGMLIAGLRRLEACRLLGWTEIPVRVLDLDDLLSGQRDENVVRKDFTPSEAVAIGEACREELERQARERQATLNRPDACGNFPQAVKGKTRDQVGKIVGMSGRTYEKAKAVVEAAKTQPEEFAPLAEEMDTTGNVDLAYRKVKQISCRIEREQIAASAPEDSAVITGDFREKGECVADNSVDLIFTDPPYDVASIPLYGDLARFAARILRPGGICITYAGQYSLPAIYSFLAEGLEYLWTFAIRHSEGQGRHRKYQIRVSWKPLLVYYKPPLSVWWDWLSDLASGGKEKEGHDWQQAESEAAYYISALCPKNGLVCDPMCGSGTSLVAAKGLGLRYIGFEVDEATAGYARARLAQDHSA